MRYAQDLFGVRIAVIAMLLLALASFVKAGEESEYLTAYAVGNLPVWRLDDQGCPEFDAMLIIAYLKSHCESGTRIVAANGSLVVMATRGNHDKVRGALDRLRAFADKNVAACLKQRLSEVQVSKQQVLLFISDPNSDATQRFFDARCDDDDEDLQQALANYIIQCIPRANADQLSDLGVVAPPEEDALLVVLSPQGQLVATDSIDRTTLSRREVQRSLTEFLDKHRIELPNARAILAAAYAEAAQNGKNVLVQLGGPGCGPCIRLSLYMEAQKDLIEKDYVHVKLDTRMPGAAEVIVELRKQARGPVPWMAILSPEGKLLVTSDSEEGNIGYPECKASKLHFRKMLDMTSQQLSDADINTLIDGLGETVELNRPTPSSGKKE